MEPDEKKRLPPLSGLALNGGGGGGGGGDKQASGAYQSG